MEQVQVATTTIFSDSESCPICLGAATTVRPVTPITSETRMGWEADSTFELVGVSRIDCKQKFCFTCFHSFIAPKFDASVLYGSRGSEVRKKHYEREFKKEYGAKDPNIDLHKAFKQMQNDTQRFRAFADFITKVIQKGTWVKSDSISILDWGGGDGYISTVYADFIKFLTGLKVERNIFDYSEWSDETTGKISMSDLKKKKYDILIYSHVLEHDHDPLNPLKIGFESLKDDGVVMIELPDDRIVHVKSILRRKAKLHYHVGHFSRRSLHKLMKKVGLHGIHTKYICKSSYRGHQIQVIGGIGQKKKANNEGLPSVFSEVGSFVIYLAIEFKSRVLNKLFN